ncbi:hypothetical protein IGI04_012427 [Brassica rapa subsp. trilocularis]|uniref:Uncharacterized protein n=1 Tax=Brassica rapa subsp. trilocularis TaxID=1813537 RepID=A0ABQ7N5X5_BRACM|nr:hypothetical protein IGI04_012427 [Brassica rapa subsp. trilocularis]
MTPCRDVVEIERCREDNFLVYLVEQNCIKPFCDLLVYSYCLDGLENILRAGEAEKKKPGDVNCYSQLIVDAQGKEKIRNLQRRKDHEFRVLKIYCPLLLED